MQLLLMTVTKHLMNIEMACYKLNIDFIRKE